MGSFGWVFQNPKRPPTSCRCTRSLVAVMGVHVCPECDSIGWWPNVQRMRRAS